MAQIDETDINKFFSQGDSEKARDLKDEFNRLVAAINALDTRLTVVESGP